MQHSLCLILTFGLILSSCFKTTLSTRASLAAGDKSGSQGVLAPSTSVGESKEIATFNPNSNENTQLVVPKVQSLSGAGVTVTPGSLSIAVDLIVEEASELSETSISSEIGLAADIQVSSASAGMIIRPSENADLKLPLALSMPLPTAIGFRLQGGSRFGIFYKYFDPTSQKLVTGFKVEDGQSVKLEFDSAAGRDVLRFEGYFGAYWAAILSREIAASEIPLPKVAAEPIINKAKVAVIQPSGFVNEVDVVQKQAVAELVWDKPILVLDPQLRLLRLTAQIPGGQAVQSCKVDFFDKPIAKSGLSFDSPLGLAYELTLLREQEHFQYGRFRCVDLEGRVTISPWSNEVFVPGASSLSPDSLLCHESNSHVRLMSSGLDGNFYDVNWLQRVANCRYTARVSLWQESRFFISSPSLEWTCGLANHSLTAGDQNLSCLKTVAGNFGSNYLTLPSGNYQMTVDFTGSKTTPKLSLAFVPCSHGDMYVRLVDNSSNLATAAVADKMIHKGGCEFEKVITPSDFVSKKLHVQNQAGTYSCGSISPSPMHGGDHYQHNICSAGALKSLSFMDVPAAPGYKIVVRLPNQTGSPEDLIYPTDAFEMKVMTGCPDRLYISSIAMGLTPVEGRNILHRYNGCDYSFSTLVDRANLSDYNFKIKTLDGSRTCGGVFDGTDAPLNCAAGAPVLNPGFSSEKLYYIKVQGNNFTGALNTVVSTENQLPCSGRSFYLQNEITNGVSNSLTKVMSEVRECVYEKVWTPASGNLGFFVTGNNFSVSSAFDQESNRPTVNGAPIAIWEWANSDITKILPVGITVGTPYKIVLDARDPNGTKLSVKPHVSPGTCAGDLHLVSPTVVGETLQSSNRFSHLGNCQYLFTLKNTTQQHQTMLYRIKAVSPAIECGIISNPGLTLASRSLVPECASSVAPYEILLPLDHAVRFHVTVSSSGIPQKVVLQDQNFQLHGLRLEGPAAAAFSDLDKSFKWPEYYSWNDREVDLILNKSTSESFYLSWGTAKCWPGSTVNNILNTDIPLVCGPRENSPPFMFSYSPGTYRLRMLAGETPESSPIFRVESLQLLSSAVLSKRLTSGVYVEANAGPNAVPNGDVTTTPGALSGAVTWSDNSGDLYVFGGSISGMNMNSLWHYSVGSQVWSLVDGTTTPNLASVNGGTPRPGARVHAMGWSDASRQRLYLYGGFGSGDTGVQGNLGDLWYYDIVSLQWHYVRGSLTADTAGDYSGTLGVANDNVFPPARTNAASFIDSSGNLWLFGGQNSYLNGFYNDLWKFVPGSGSGSLAGQWAFMGGEEGVTTSGGSPTWPSARTFSATWSLGSQGVLFGGANSSENRNDIWTLNFASGSWQLLQANKGAAEFWENMSFHRANRPQPIYGKVATWAKNNDELWLFFEGTFYTYRISLGAWALASTAATVHGEFNEKPTDAQIISADYSPTNFTGKRNDALFWSNSNGFYFYGGRNSWSGEQFNDLWQFQFSN